MTVYSTDHASALADVREAGAPVTFTHTTVTQDDATGAPNAPVVTTVAGVAIRVHGNPILYRDLGLVEGEAPTLLFVPATMGQLPALDAAVTWNGIGYLVRNVSPLALDGPAILARIVIGR